MENAIHDATEADEYSSSSNDDSDAPPDSTDEEESENSDGDQDLDEEMNLENVPSFSELMAKGMAAFLQRQKERNRPARYSKGAIEDKSIRQKQRIRKNVKQKIAKNREQGYGDIRNMFVSSDVASQKRPTKKPETDGARKRPSTEHDSASAVVCAVKFSKADDGQRRQIINSDNPGGRDVPITLDSDSETEYDSSRGTRTVPIVLDDARSAADQMRATAQEKEKKPSGLGLVAKPVSNIEIRSSVEALAKDFGIGEDKLDATMAWVENFKHLGIDEDKLETDTSWVENFKQVVGLGAIDGSAGWVENFSTLIDKNKGENEPEDTATETDKQDTSEAERPTTPAQHSTLRSRSRSTAPTAIPNPLLEGVGAGGSGSPETPPLNSAQALSEASAGRVENFKHAGQTSRPVKRRNVVLSEDEEEDEEDEEDERERRTTHPAPMPMPMPTPTPAPTPRLAATSTPAPAREDRGSAELPEEEGQKEPETKFVSLCKDDPRLKDVMTRLEIITKDKKLDTLFRDRVCAMLIFLRLYVSNGGYTWTSASNLTAEISGRGEHFSRRLREWTWKHILDHQWLPVNLYGRSKKSIMCDERISMEIREHLRTLGKKYFTAEDVQDYINKPEFLERMNRTKPYSLSTATRVIKEIGFTYGKERKGMYVDGHERDDVKAYRDNVFLPMMAKYEEDMGYEESEDGVLRPPPPDCHTPPKIILVTHDESTFYANDQRQTGWHDNNEPAKPQPKGEGASIMVSDFCTPQTGFLRHG